MATPLTERGKGRFQLGQWVTWQSARTKPMHIGKIVEIVEYGQYPSIVRPPQCYPEVTWKELCRIGYYREFESYVVEDANGKRWWPRVGTLRVLHDAPQQADERLLHST